MNKSHRTESIPLSIVEKRRSESPIWLSLYICYLCLKGKILFAAKSIVNNTEYISIHYTPRLGELAKMAEFVSINKLLFAIKCDNLCDFPHSIKASFVRST